MSELDQMLGVLPRSEYEGRWERAQESCRREGLDAALVWSRGGGAFDAHWDVFYLSGHYSPFPLVVDHPPHWTGRSHAVVVVPAEGEPTLIVDIPDWRRDRVAIEDTRYTPDVVPAVARVVEERNLSDKRIGLVGESFMAASTYRLLLEALLDAEIASVNNLVEDLHVLKSPREIELIRHSVSVGDKVIDTIVKTALTPGNSEADAAAAGYFVAAKEGAAIMQMAIASGPHSNSFTHGGLPGWTKRTLEEGDFFHVDCFGCVDGYQFDFGRACVVGGEPTDDQLEVLEAGIDSVDAGIDAIRPGVRGQEVYATVHAVLEERDALGDGGELTTPSLTLALGMYGHSFGAGWGWPWLSHHEERELQAGMCLAVETMPGRVGVGAGYFEQDILVTDEGAELLTQTPKRYW